LTGWQAINREFPAFASLPADAISYPLRIAGDTRSAAFAADDAAAAAAPGPPARQPSPEAFRPASRNHQNLPTRTGDGLVPTRVPQPLAPSTGRGRL